MAKIKDTGQGNLLTEDILEHLDYIQSTINEIGTSSAAVQSRIKDMVWEQVQYFEIKDGRFRAQQDARKRLLMIEDRMTRILRGKNYTESVRGYLNSFAQIEAQVSNLHKDYNEIEVDLEKVSPTRKLVYNQAKDALFGSGIKAIYQTPVNHMLLYQITTGGSVSDMETILNRWSRGDLSAGSKSPTGKPIPNLQQYTTQLARDTSYQFNGTINEIIRDQYDLDGMHYAGDLIEDSRPICVYLIQLKRDVSFIELREILNRPDLMPGRMPGTTVKNFCTKRGGFGCRHMSFPVRMKLVVVEKPKPAPAFVFSQGNIEALRNKGVRVYHNDRTDDVSVLDMLKKKFQSFNPERLIDEIDRIASEHGVKWERRSLSFYKPISAASTYLQFSNTGSFNHKEISLSRRFYGENWKLKGVYHSLFTLPKELQGKNFAKDIFSALLQEYKAMGLKEITVTANIDVGGYAWANYGFEARDPQEVLSMFSKLKSRVEAANGRYIYTDNKGRKTIIDTKEIDRIQSIIQSFYTKHPGAPFPLSRLSKRKSGKALLLGTFWSGVLDLTKKRKLSIFEDYLKKK